MLVRGELQERERKSCRQGRQVVSVGRSEAAGQGGAGTPWFELGGGVEVEAGLAEEVGAHKIA